MNIVVIEQPQFGGKLDDAWARMVSLACVLQPKRRGEMLHRTSFERSVKQNVACSVS
jgi:hypothetical protein